MTPERSLCVLGGGSNAFGQSPSLVGWVDLEIHAQSLRKLLVQSNRARPIAQSVEHQQRSAKRAFIAPVEFHCTPRHAGGSNIVFADSHAKFVQASKMIGAYGPSGNTAPGGYIEYPVVNPLNIPPQ